MMLNIAFDIKAEARDQLISDLRINALWEETLGVYFNLDCNPIVTTLSTHYWDEKEAGREPSIECTFSESGLLDFNPITGKCALCTREKFYILFKPEMASLNKRQEVFGFCRHKEAKLLEKKPPEVK